MRDGLQTGKNRKPYYGPFPYKKQIYSGLGKKKAKFYYCCRKEVLFLECVGLAAAFKDCCGGVNSSQMTGQDWRSDFLVQ